MSAAFPLYLSRDADGNDRNKRIYWVEEEEEEGDGWESAWLGKPDFKACMGSNTQHSD